MVGYSSGLSFLLDDCQLATAAIPPEYVPAPEACLLESNVGSNPSKDTGDSVKAYIVF